MNRTNLARIALALFLFAFAGAAFAQSGSLDALGGGLWDAVCEFTKSPIVAVVAAVALITLVVLFMLDEARGFMSTLLKIAIGVAVILNIGTVLQLIGLQRVMNC